MLVFGWKGVIILLSCGSLTPIPVQACHHDRRVRDVIKRSHSNLVNSLFLTSPSQTWPPAQEHLSLCKSVHLVQVVVECILMKPYTLSTRHSSKSPHQPLGKGAFAGSWGMNRGCSGAGPHLPPNGPQREGPFRALWGQVGALSHGMSGDDWG